MSKPDWNDAPYWANYLAMDSDEGWYWYEDEPWLDTANGDWISGGSCRRGEPCSARDTLEKRP